MGTINSFVFKEKTQGMVKKGGSGGQEGLEL